jgi:hypothetical protein
MKKTEETKLVEVFSGTSWEAGIVKSLLENAEIQVYLKEEVRGTLAPWHVAPGGVAAVKVIVADSDLENAKQVVTDYKNNNSPEDGIS